MIHHEDLTLTKILLNESEVQDPKKIELHGQTAKDYFLQ